MSETQHKFWMVYGMGRGAPTYRHETREAAEQEAQRLAQVSPGTRFVVLAAVASFETDRPEVREVKISKMTRQQLHDLYNGRINQSDLDSEIPF